MRSSVDTIGRVTAAVQELLSADNPNVSAEDLARAAISEYKSCLLKMGLRIVRLDQIKLEDE